MTTSTDVLFVFPPGRGNAGTFKNHLGAAYLRAALAREGVSTHQYLSRNPGTIDSVAAEIIKRQCPIVGFTVYDTNASLSIAIARRIKQQSPETRIVFGGPSVTFNAQALMERNAVIDVCIMGEAEKSGPQILTKLLEGDVFDIKLPGVASRKDGEVVCTALPPLAGSNQLPIERALDSSPSPYLSGLLADGQEGVLTGRGCTYHCQYCCFAALSRNRVRLHSIERVVAELEHIAAQQKRAGERMSVPIHDDAFTLLPLRAKTLCQAIADRKLGLTLSCMTRADTLDEELIRLMCEAGFRSISFGLESAVPSVLRATGKVRPPDWPESDLAPETQFLDRVRNSVALAKKYGFKVAVSIILGLPTETPADAAETLRFVSDLGVNSYAHNFLWVFPGTPLWKTHDAYGIRCTADNIGLPETTGHSYNLNAIRPRSKSHLEKEANLARLLATDSLLSCNAVAATGKGIEAVVLHGAELLPETADWLRKVLKIGGVVVHVYPRMRPTELRSRLHLDRRVLSDHMVAARHYIQVYPRKTNKRKSHLSSWLVTSAGLGFYANHRTELMDFRVSHTSAPLIAWAEGRDARADGCDVCRCLTQRAAIVRFMARMRALGSPRSLQQMPAPPELKYPGRWLRGTAPCLLLSRIEVSQNGEIRCCAHSEPIGRVGDFPSTLSERLMCFRQVVEQRRGCNRCQNTQCPRCLFPVINDRTYCHIMNNQQEALRSLEWVHLYSRLPLLAAVA